MSPVRWGSPDAAITGHCREKMKLLTARHWTTSTGQEHPKRRRWGRSWGRKIVGVVCCSTLCFCRLHSLPVFGRLHVDVMSFFGDSCGRHFNSRWACPALKSTVEVMQLSPRHLLFTSAVCFLMGWLDLNLSLILLFLFFVFIQRSHDNEPHVLPSHVLPSTEPPLIHCPKLRFSIRCCMVLHTEKVSCANAISSDSMMCTVRMYIYIYLYIYIHTIYIYINIHIYIYYI